MSLDDRIVRLTREAQQRIFRLAERDCGLTLKAISLDSGVPYSTIRTYASGEAIMPITALIRLADVIPDTLLSQLFDPVDRHLVKDSDDYCLDELGEAADDVAAKVRRARHPNSPGGIEIIDAEAMAIRRASQRVRV